MAFQLATWTLASLTLAFLTLAFWTLVEPLKQRESLLGSGDGQRLGCGSVSTT